MEKKTKYKYRSFELGKNIGEVKFAKYPWEKCIADMKDQGKTEEAANAICGAIKAGTVNR